MKALCTLTNEHKLNLMILKFLVRVVKSMTEWQQFIPMYDVMTHRKSFAGETTWNIVADNSIRFMYLFTHASFTCIVEIVNEQERRTQT